MTMQGNARQQDEGAESEFVTVGGAVEEGDVQLPSGFIV